MSGLFDSAESVILNVFRRLIALAVLAAIVVSISAGIYGYGEFKAVPAVTGDDVFDVPVFEPVVDAEEPEEPEAEPDPGWVHPMPEHKAMLDTAIESLMPLYIAYFHFEGALEERQRLTDFFHVYLERLPAYLNEEQMNAVMAGMTAHVSAETAYYMDKYEVPTVPDFYLKRYGTLEPDEEMLEDGSYFSYLKTQVRPSVPEDLATFLGNPAIVYRANAMQNYEKLQEDAREAEMEALDTNAHGLDVLRVAVLAVMLAALLVLVLVLFKVELSLRRAAEAPR